MLRVTGLKKQFETDRGASVAAVYDVSFEVETGRLPPCLAPAVAARPLRYV
jgi:ABC-type Na+ transport system ATPase subunit NatA